MNDRTNTSLEQLSALADGQLPGDELAQVLEAVNGRAELREAWQTYHVVGEVLRTGHYVHGSNPSAFMSRLQERLAVEVIEPQRPQLLPQPHAYVRPTQAAAANEPVFRWKMAAGLASVAAAAAIGWAWVGTGLDDGLAGSQLAVRQVPAGSGSVLAVSTLPQAPLAQTRVSVGGGAPQIMLRDPRLDELLEAHQQSIGASQMPSGFLRNATFEGAAR